MRLALVGYFDLGTSFGIGDEVFPDNHLRPGAEILQVGIRSPLGEGISFDVLKRRQALISAWCEASRSILRRPEMELGEPEAGCSKEEHIGLIESELVEARIARCELTIIAVGVALLWFELGDGIPEPLLNGVGKCFEFAAYTSTISGAFLQLALDAVPQSTQQRSTTLRALSKRPAPDKQTDATGHSELRLFTSFTRVVQCRNAAEAAIACTRFQAGERNPVLIEFEYHGSLHFGWGTCVVVPRNPDDLVEGPDQQLARIMECMRIAHLFLGACEAFE